jgi:hypothetical protein
MAQTLVPEEEFLLGDGEVLVCFISHAHKGVHLVGVGELLGIGIGETDEVSAAFEVLCRQHKGQGASSIVGEIEGRPVFQGKVSAFVIHFEGSGAPFLKISLRREKANGGFRNVVGGTTEFAGRPEDVLDGPFDVSFPNAIDFAFEAIKVRGAAGSNCADKVGDGRGYQKRSARIDDDWKIIVFAGEIQGRR